MIKHTPGPWQVYRPNKFETGPTRIALANSNNPMSDEICVLYINPDGSTGNAELIAAAPEMLEALKAIVKNMRNPAQTDDFWQERTIAVELCEKAIAKAEGRS